MRASITYISTMREIVNACLTLYQQYLVRGVINKFVDNVSRFFSNTPMEMIFANNIVWLICYKLRKHFSDIFRKLLVMVAMVTYECQ